MAVRMSDQEVEDMMKKKISDAIYPVLIPFEEQSCQIQAENQKKIDELSVNLWREYLKTFEK